MKRVSYNYSEIRIDFFPLLVYMLILSYSRPKYYIAYFCLGRLAIDQSNGRDSESFHRVHVPALL